MSEIPRALEAQLEALVVPILTACDVAMKADEPGGAAPCDACAMKIAEAAYALGEQATREKEQELLEVLKEYVEWFGAVHGQECPGDDTCNCVGGGLNARVNAAIRRHDELAALRSSVKPEGS